MKTGVVPIHGVDYQTVALRVSQFRETYANDLSIETEILESTDKMVLVKASIRNLNGVVISTGHAEEDRSKGVNKTSAIENAETSAVGRALAFIGLGGTQIASADEMRKQQGRPETITDEQIVKIEDLLKKTKSDRDKFCVFMKVDSVENIPVSAYDTALKALEKKKGK